MIKITYSNQIEQLYEALKVKLFNNDTSPFCRRLIVVPSPALKSWLMMQLAKDPSIGIAAGIEVSYLDQTIEQFNQSKKTHSPLELALFIESFLRNVLSSASDFDSEKALLWKPLVSYLEAAPLKREKRLTALSENLAALFKNYSLYKHDILEKGSNWQAALWNEIGKKHSSFVPNLKIEKPISLHLFAISFIPGNYHRFFQELSKVFSVDYYFLSPCQLFWSDLLTVKESRVLLKGLKKANAPKPQMEILQDILNDTNPLLANFGKLGREMAKQIEESDALCESIYLLPQSILDIQAYQEHLTPEEFHLEEQTQFNLLEALKADLLLMRNPEKGLPIAIKDAEKSIQIHISSSKGREVQSVYDLIMGLIAKHGKDKDPISPSDFIVMAPDIMDYEAWIKATFGSSESRIDYQILDLASPALNPLVQAFLKLLDLDSGRWDSISLLRLFECVDFQKAKKITKEEVSQIRSWVKEVGIYWGMDAFHRNQILKRRYHLNEIGEQTAIGTWEYGFERLLTGLAMTADGDEAAALEFEHYPFESIDSQDAEFLGHFIAIVRSLKSDLSLFNDGTQMTISEWVSHVKKIANEYLGIDGSLDDHQSIKAIFEQLEKASEQLPAFCCSFQTIHKHIESALNRQKVNFRENHLQSVRFCSMLPMRALPAKVIILIGMEEGAYPRALMPDSFDLLNELGKEYCPTPIDFDRFLFLEILLSARQYLILSYQGYSSETGSENLPSLIVSEMVSYLDKAFSINGEKPSETIIVKHPFNAFDASNFSDKNPFRSYSPFYYRAALSFYEGKKKDKHRFISDFAIQEHSKKIEKTVLDLKSLESFFKNPLKSFFNGMGMHIKSEETGIKSDEELALSNLEKSVLKKKAVYQPMETVLRAAYKEAKMPQGLFRLLAEREVESKAEEVFEHFKSLKIDPKSVFSIEFNEAYNEPRKLETGSWNLPPLSITYQGQRIKIIGKFDEVASAGLISHKEKKEKYIAGQLPGYLVFASLIKQYQLPIDANLLICHKKSHSLPPFFDDPTSLLEKFLDYYFLCQKNPSPLLPEFIERLNKDEEACFAETIKGEIHNDYHESYNDYLKWLYRDADPAPLSSHNHWKEKAENLFGEAFDHWFSKKGKRK